MPQADLILHDAEQVCTMAGGRDSPLRGKGQSETSAIEGGAIAIQNGRIAAVGSSEELLRECQAARSLALTGALVTPGLVDPHTHPVFAAYREQEHRLRLEGASYQAIAAAGGGILNTVRKLRETEADTLVGLIRPHLDEMLAHGTTTIEAKSGYGLNLEDELKSLRVIARLNKEHPIELVPTFLGAHEVPEEFKGQKGKYIDLVIKKMLPRVAKEGLAESCDVFCEEGVFSVEDSRRILSAAKEAGLSVRLHAEEFATLGGAELAAELGALSADHLMAISKKGMRAMAAAGVTAVLLPGTTFALGLSRYAPARELIEAGLPVALATDFNPGTCLTESLQIIMALACSGMRMTPSEVLVAATANAAWAAGRGGRCGVLAEGLPADLVVWRVPNHDHIPYHFGINLVEAVYKNGNCVWGAEP